MENKNDGIFLLSENGKIKVTQPHELPPIPVHIVKGCSLIEIAYELAEGDFESLTPTDVQFLDMCLAQTIKAVEQAREKLNSHMSE